jgi:hypothetical protein
MHSSCPDGREGERGATRVREAGAEPGGEKKGRQEAGSGRGRGVWPTGRRSGLERRRGPRDGSDACGSSNLHWSRSSPDETQLPPQAPAGPRRPRSCEERAATAAGVTRSGPPKRPTSSTHALGGAVIAGGPGREMGAGLWQPVPLRAAAGGGRQGSEAVTHRPWPNRLENSLAAHVTHPKHTRPGPPRSGRT